MLNKNFGDFVREHGERIGDPVDFITLSSNRARVNEVRKYVNLFHKGITFMIYSQHHNHFQIMVIIRFPMRKCLLSSVIIDLIVNSLTFLFLFVLSIFGIV